MDIVFHPIEGFGFVVEGPFEYPSDRRIVLVQWSERVGGVYFEALPRLRELAARRHMQRELEAARRQAGLLSNLFDEGDPIDALR